jgi:hypothetical protein
MIAMTPVYKGSGQPPADSGGGLFGNLGALFGSQAPAYKGAGQPSVSGSSFFGGGSPAYASAPSAPSANVAMTPIDPSTCPIDPAALAAGQIAIVIPRGVLVTP